MLGVDWVGLWNNIQTAAIRLFVNGGLVLLEFLAVLIIGLLLIKVICKIIRKILSRTKLNSITQKFLISTIKFALNLVLIIILIQIVGIPVTGFVAVLSAAGLAVGLALQDCLSNFFNGVIIVSGKYFKEGDFVEISGVSGKVTAIKLLYTTITTNDNKTITLPNSSIINSTIINYCANEKRRVDFSFSLALYADIEKAKKVVFRVFESDGRINLEPEPFVAIDKISGKGVDLFAYCWCDTEDYWDVYYYVVENVFNEFKRNGINVPYSQMELRVRNDDVTLPYNKEALPVRVEKERKVDEEIHSLEDLLDQGAKIIKKRKKKEK